LALTSPISGGGSVGIVCLQTQVTEFVCFLFATLKDSKITENRCCPKYSLLYTAPFFVPIFARHAYFHEASGKDELFKPDAEAATGRILEDGLNSLPGMEGMHDCNPNTVKEKETERICLCIQSIHLNFH
jgi:hypothetical protein